MRISEDFGRPGSWYIPGKLQRVQEEIQSIERHLRRWGERDRETAWLKIQSLQRIVAELDRRLEHGTDVIREADFAELQAEAELWRAAETARQSAKRLAADNRILAEMHGRYDTVKKAIGEATTLAQCAALKSMLDDMADTLRRQSQPAAKRKSIAPSAAHERLPLDPKHADRKRIADRSHGR